MATRRLLALLGALWLAGQGLAQEPLAPGFGDGQYPSVVSEQDPSSPAAPMEAELGDQFLPQPPPQDLPPIPRSWLASFWNPQPTLEIRAEALFLKADFPTFLPLARQVQIDPTGSVYGYIDTVIEAKEQYIAAPRLALEWHINHYHSVEAVGFIMDGPNQYLQPLGQTDSSPFFLDANATNPRARGYMTQLPPGFPTIADNILVNWLFRAKGGELNYLHHFILVDGPFSDLAVGIGARYFGIEEKVTAQFTDLSQGNLGFMGANADNEMAGAQILGRARFQTPLRWLRAVSEARIALMANTTQTRMSVFAPSSGYNVGTRFSTTVFSPLFEGNFLFECFLTKNITAFTGLQLLYSDRVNRAGGQFTPNVGQFLYDPERLSSVFLWGPRVGLVLAW